MKFKSDVKVFGIRPEMVLALMVANDIYKQHTGDMTVTSVCEGLHSRASLHYAGCAVDLRTTAAKLPSSTIKTITGQIRSALPDEYDVVLEKDHLHIEFQPKRY